MCVTSVANMRHLSIQVWATTMKMAQPNLRNPWKKKHFQGAKRRGQKWFCLFFYVPIPCVWTIPWKLQNPAMKKQYSWPWYFEQYRIKSSVIPAHCNTVFPGKECSLKYFGIKVSIFYPLIHVRLRPIKERILTWEFLIYLLKKEKMKNLLKI